MQRHRVSVAAALALVAAVLVFVAGRDVFARNGRGLPEPAATLGGSTHQVGISGFTYTPNDLTIQVGDSVDFAASGTHPLRSDDDLFSCNAACTQTFDTPGEYRYYCANHGGAGGQGMSGIIIVQAATAPVLELSVTSLAAQAAAGESTTQTFDIGNTGDAPLDWTADTSSGDCASPVAVPWLSVDPAAGSVAQGAQSSVDAIFDASALDPGTYSANLCVHSNDPAHNPVTLPVEFTVTAVDLIFENGFDGPPE